MALQVLDDGHLLLAGHVERDHGVEALVGGERGAQRPPVDGHGRGAHAGAVHHRRDLARGPEAAGSSRTKGTADLGRHDDLSHRKLLLQRSRRSA
jgi:hypothetical protein